MRPGKCVSTLASCALLIMTLLTGAITSAEPAVTTGKGGLVANGVGKFIPNDCNYLAVVDCEAWRQTPLWKRLGSRFPEAVRLFGLTHTEDNICQEFWVTGTMDVMTVLVYRPQLPEDFPCQKLNWQLDGQPVCRFEYGEQKMIDFCQYGKDWLVGSSPAFLAGYSALARGKSPLLKKLAKLPPNAQFKMLFTPPQAADGSKFLVLPNFRLGDGLLLAEVLNDRILVLANVRCGNELEAKRLAADARKIVQIVITQIGSRFAQKELGNQILAGFQIGAKGSIVSAKLFLDEPTLVGLLTLCKQISEQSLQKANKK